MHVVPSAICNGLTLEAASSVTMLENLLTVIAIRSITRHQSDYRNSYFSKSVRFVWFGLQGKGRGKLTSLHRLTCVSCSLVESNLLRRHT